jgi:hypothetical protein
MMKISESTKTNLYALAVLALFLFSSSIDTLLLSVGM